MGLMAGMLPGVECARRRRIGQQGAAEAPCGTRRRSLCLYAGGHDHASHLLGSPGCSKERRSSACAGTWTLDSNAREAKERLDQKLRSQRESVVKKRQSTTGSSTTTKETRATSRDWISNHSPTSTATEDEAPATMTCVLHREVLTGKNGPGGGGATNNKRRRFIWSRLGRRKPPAVTTTTTECAVCLEDLRVGDVLVQLPCAHRFHWACAVPWVKAASRCPICRAHVHLLAAAEDEQPRVQYCNTSH